MAKKGKDDQKAQQSPKDDVKKQKTRNKGNAELSISSYDEPSGNEQSDYEDKLAMQIDFSSEDDEEELRGITIKGMGRKDREDEMKQQRLRKRDDKE